MKKMPIDEYGEGNCCPNCGSVKISVYYQYAMEVEEDLKTGREIIRDANGKRISNPSNRLLARLYKISQFEAQMWIYGCRRCGWRSEAFVP